MWLLRKIDYVLEKAEIILLAFGVIIMTVVMMINVFLRFFFNKSVVVAEEVGTILILGVTYLGLSYVTRHGRSIRMNVLYDFIGLKYRKILAAIIALITGITVYYFSYYAFKYMLAIKISKRVTSSLQIPSHYIAAIVAIGLFISGTQFIRIFFLNIKSIRNPKEKDYIGTYPIDN